MNNVSSVYLTFKNGFQREILVSTEIAEDVFSCVEEKIFKRFVFKMLPRKIVSFNTFDVLSIEIKDF